MRPGLRPQAGLANTSWEPTPVNVNISGRSRRLGKESLAAFQASKRTGELYCTVCGDRVKISGKAVLFAVSDIML